MFYFSIFLFIEQSKAISSDQKRSRAIKSDHERSKAITGDQKRSRANKNDHNNNNNNNNINMFFCRYGLYVFIVSEKIESAITFR